MHKPSTLHYLFGIILMALLLVKVMPIHAQDDQGIRISEYYWSTPLVKVLGDFKFKYKADIEYDSAMVKGFTLDYLFTNTPIATAVEVVFRNNPEVGYFMDDKNHIKVIPRSILNASKLTSANQKFKGKPTKFNFTASGIVKDRQSGEPLPFASVLIRGTSKGCSSNIDGYFTLPNIPTDTSAILVFYLGYYKQLFYLSPHADVHEITILMDPVTTQLKTVEVKGQREDLLKASEGGNLIKMAPAKLAELPSLGEKDIFRTFQLMPGIGGGSGSSAGLFVRGGTPDQNLILYDGFTVYHQEHLFGMFSAFNPNAIKEVQLYREGSRLNTGEGFPL
ncbi:MAG: TonB-dependent receptor [Bacteroidales bacterium]|nr:TonB-dependent receptor [Bacteroidales bacterium]